MANRIRIFLRELLGSRLVERLEEDLLRQRQDFEARLQDKDQVIADLRTEKATLLGKIIMYERTLLPLSSRAGSDIVNASKPQRPNFGLDFSAPRPVSRWEQVQADHEKALAEESDQDTQAAAKGA